MMSNKEIKLFFEYLITNLENIPFFKEHPEIDKTHIKSYLKKILDNLDNNEITIYTDGASRGNPGKAGAGYVLYKNGKIIKKGNKYLGIKTNNEAEYNALILALKNIDNNTSNINIFSDSELMVKQLKGLYKVKNEKLKPLYNEVNNLLKNKNYKIFHVRRDKNKLADKLANEAIDNHPSLL